MMRSCWCLRVEESLSVIRFQLWCLRVLPLLFLPSFLWWRIKWTLCRPTESLLRPWTAIMTNMPIGLFESVASVEKSRYFIFLQSVWWVKSLGCSNMFMSRCLPLTKHIACRNGVMTFDQNTCSWGHWKILFLMFLFWLWRRLPIKSQKQTSWSSYVCLDLAYS